MFSMERSFFVFFFFFFSGIYSSFSENQQQNASNIQIKDQEFELLNKTKKRIQDLMLLKEDFQKKVSILKNSIFKKKASKKEKKRVYRNMLNAEKEFKRNSGTRLKEAEFTLNKINIAKKEQEKDLEKILQNTRFIENRLEELKRVIIDASNFVSGDVH